MNKRTFIFLLIHFGFWIIDFARIYVYREETPTGHLPSFLLLIFCVFYFNFYVLVPKIIKLNKNGTFLLWFLTFIAFSGILLSSWRTFAGVIETWDLSILLREVGLNIHTGFYYGGIGLILKLSHDWLKNQEFNESLILEKTDMELQYMKSNINIPFMVDVLDYTEKKAKNAPSEVADPILQLSNVLRYGLYESEEQITSISSELEIIRDYISLAELTKPDLRIILDIKSQNTGLKTIPNFITKVLSVWVESLNKETQEENKITLNDYQDGFLMSLQSNSANIDAYPRPESRLFSINYHQEDNILNVYVTLKIGK